jgi:GNAT superfamily N-acetyltransferase
MPTTGVVIQSGYTPGAIGRIVEMHGSYYAAAWGFPACFETKVARELAEFVDRFDDRRDGFWTASIDGRIVGSVVVDALRAADEGAHLRWFIVADEARGSGVGRRLLDAGLAFCRGRGYPCVFLWTFEGLHPARHLYEAAGFRLAEEQRGARWGAEVTEQRFVALLCQHPLPAPA